MARAIRALFAAMAVLICCTPMHPQNPVFETRAKERGATVSIMALTSIVHRGFSGNEDVYLADVGFKEGEHELARLVDFYPASANPIQRTILTERHSLKMRLTRTPNCDTAYRNVLVATREANIFDASVRATLSGQPDEVVPCFRIAHDATRLAKK
jgi:hypothetical protein